MTNTIAVSATATDNVGVTGVQFTLDGGNLGTEDTSAPFSTTWDTRGVPNGTHTLRARARDAAGNTTTSAAVEITVDNPPVDTSGLVGAWGFEEASGNAVSDSSSQGNHGSLSAATRTTAGRFGSARPVQRDHERGHRAGRELARPGDGHDARGLALPHRHAVRLADGAGQGADRRPLLRPVRQHEHEPPEREHPHERRGRHPRHRGAGRRDVVARRRHVRRRHAALLRQRHAGLEQGDRRLADRDHRRPAHGRQLVRGRALRRQDRRGPGLQPRADGGRDHHRHGPGRRPGGQRLDAADRAHEPDRHRRARARDAGLDGGHRRHGARPLQRAPLDHRRLHAERRQPRSPSRRGPRTWTPRRPRARTSTRSPPRTRPATSAPPPTRRRRS